MVFNPKCESPYLKPERLANVIAALQIMAAGERPEKKIRSWAEELSKRQDKESIDKWTAVFTEHPEFFLIYRLENESELKAALRWRYVNKLYDSKTGKEYTPEEKDRLPDDLKWSLTTKPLTSDAISALMNTAIELHSRALEELAARRWWIPIVAACFGFGGSVLGALLGGLLGSHK